MRTVAVVGDEAKKEFALRVGAHHAVLGRGQLAAVRELFGDRAVDIVIDPVGGDRMTDSLRSLAPEGRLLVLGFAAGEIPTGGIAGSRVSWSASATSSPPARCGRSCIRPGSTRHRAGRERAGGNS